MAASTARPQTGGPWPGLIVLQEAFGVNAHIRDVTRRFAAAGYVVIAPELYHRTAPGFEGSYADFDAIRAHMGALTEAGLSADLQAAHAWLRAQADVKPDATAAVGFCMGGRVAFLANAVLPLAAAVSFYGGGIAPALLGHAAALHGPMLFFWGGLDQHIDAAQRRAVVDAVTVAGRPFLNVEISDADHGFFCDARPSYNARAAGFAWDLTLSFLRASLP
ncbi:MAG: dienelactone hydrolase family protein [Acidobacteriota bacterium]|nr:dienelactone hydrolase family protein [Acidobacteriota bacterium]